MAETHDDSGLSVTPAAIEKRSLETPRDKGAFSGFALSLFFMASILAAPILSRVETGIENDILLLFLSSGGVGLLFSGVAALLRRVPHIREASIAAVVVAAIVGAIVSLLVSR